MIENTMEKIKKTFTNIRFMGQNIKTTTKPAKIREETCAINNTGSQTQRVIAFEKIIGRYPYEMIKLPLDSVTASKLHIPNMRIMNNNSMRGETLSSKGNRWAIKAIKKCGIESVIDLREKYTSSSYKDLCLREGLKYYSFPIDSHEVPDEKIIQNFPLMFNVLNQGRYYIACAQGLHRTDIALALNYVFNPDTKEIPVMAGHYQDKMEIDDVKRRINSIYKKIKDADLENLGWGENAREEILKRKAELVNNFNENKPQKYFQ